MKLILPPQLTLNPKTPAISLLCRFCFLVAALALSSCEVARQAPFREEDYLASQRIGTGSVAGQAVLEARDGKVREGDHIQVELVPVTPYTTEFIEQQCRDGHRLSAGDPRFPKYVRSTTTDAVGNFAFHQLPAGDYYAATKFPYLIEEGSYIYQDDGSALSVTNTYREWQWIFHRVTVRSGQTSGIPRWYQGDYGVH